MRRLFLILVLLPSLLTSSLGAMNVLVGTYTKDGRSQGIYRLEMDSSTGALSKPVLAASCANPTFLSYDAASGVLVATSELEQAEKGSFGALAAFRWQGASRTLVPLSTCAIAPKGGSTHVALSPDAKTAFAVHYNAAWVASMPLSSEGELGPVSSLLYQTGQTGPHPQRQDAPHAHSITLSPDGRQAYVCDLGLDTVFVYTVKAGTGELTLSSQAATPAGAGPRHSKCSADGRFLYVVNELSGSLSVFAREAAKGSLSLLSTTSLLPEGFTGENTSAEIQLHPSGAFAYASSRGPDILTVLALDGEGGAQVVQRISSGGRHPRHFALSPDGRFLICANRDTDSLVVFTVAEKTGVLEQTTYSAGVSQAVCIQFVP